MTVGLQLGRPGIYQVAVREPAQLTEVRLDVTGFVGVALRGPVNVATPVISWADFERRFGGLEPNVSGRDRMLPYAVQAFFAQGGRRAWVVRVEPVVQEGEPSAEEATARFRLGPQPAEPNRLVTPRDLNSSDATKWELAAAGEGAWGTALDIRLAFAATLTLTADVKAPDRLLMPAGGEIPDGSLLRIRYGTARVGVLRWTRVLPDPKYQFRLVALSEPLPTPSDQREPPPGSAVVEVITGTLQITDPSGPARIEQIDRLGLHPDHPRFPPNALADQSLLVRTAGDWAAPLVPDLQLRAWTGALVRKGRDRSDRVDSNSFFDAGEADDDPLDEDSHCGVDLMGRESEIGLLCVPDLTWRSQPIPQPVPDPPTNRFVWRPECWCATEPPEQEPIPVVAPLPSMLDGRDGTELAEISWRQQRLVQVADLRRRFVVLLDVPTGLPTAKISDWRAAFDSSFAAAYHPWLGVPHPDRGLGLAVMVPPSAFAAGIIAERERRLGLSRGPANQLALGAVVAADPVTDALADQLHLLSINVFFAERDGFRLSAARTLSSDPDYRQLSVRRLMTMLAISLQRYGEGLLVFEPNTFELRARVTNSITELLRDLHRRGAFSGATEEQSFFVRCDDATNPPQSQALGRLVAEIGVAPAAPLEYLILRIASDGEGGLLINEQARITETASPEPAEVTVV
jgi:Bacteriophage tail sheath protein